MRGALAPEAPAGVPAGIPPWRAAGRSCRSCRGLPPLGALALALLVLLAASLGARAEGRVALVMGNGHYLSAPALDNPTNDAADMAAALRDLGFQVFEGVDQTEAGMQALLADFTAAAANAKLALFYFAGHGFQVDNQNFLAPVDLRLDRPETVVPQSLALNQVLADMRAMPGQKLVFLDACSDNPLGLTQGSSGGLARMPASADFLIVLASQPNTVAFDGSGRNGTFTEALLNNIRTANQNLSEMMMSVRREVRSQTGGQQEPFESTGLIEAVILNPGPPAASPETMFYQVASRSQDQGLLRLYLDRYPDGAHVGDVLAMLQGTGASGAAVRGLGDAGDDGSELWELARRTRLRQLYDSYVELYPHGIHVEEARAAAAELPSDQDIGPARRCELLATHPRDRTESIPGVPFELLTRNATKAIQACEQAMANFPEQAKYAALLARAYVAAGLRDRAVALYQQASDRGDLRAMVSLAQLKESGDGVPKDHAGALALLERAAAAGSPDAMTNLAVALLNGEGIARDPSRGRSLLEQASREGSAIATFNLGVLAQEGQFGAPTDALDLFERAARDGYTPAYRAAAAVLDEGRGVPRDPRRAAVQLLLGLASDDGTLLREMSASAYDWRANTVAAVQERLARAGLYDGPADGAPSPGLVQALTAWRNGGFNPAVLGA